MFSSVSAYRFFHLQKRKRYFPCMQIIQSGIDWHVSLHKRASRKLACTCTNLHALAWACMHQNTLVACTRMHLLHAPERDQSYIRLAPTCIVSELTCIQVRASPFATCMHLLHLHPAYLQLESLACQLHFTKRPPLTTVHNRRKAAEKKSGNSTVSCIVDSGGRWLYSRLPCPLVGYNTCRAKKTLSTGLQ